MSTPSARIVKPDNNGPSDAGTSPARGIDLDGGRHMAKPSPGIRRTHSPSCPARTNRDRCVCSAGYEASVYDRHTGEKIRKTFPTTAAARAWRSDAEHGVRRGTLRAAGPTTVNEAADEAIAGM